MSELQGELDRLERLLIETIALGTTPPIKVGNSTVTFNAGGIGVWLSALCSIVSVIVLYVVLGQSNTKSIEQAIKIAEQDRKIERMQDHLSAIYMIAPSLKPKDEEKVSSEP